MSLRLCWLLPLLACSAPADPDPDDYLSDPDRFVHELMAERHRWLHDERAYMLDLDVDQECAPCHLPSHLQLFREKLEQRREREGGLPD